MVVAVTMVRDEADIVAETVGRMADQVDLVIVADNLSMDGTRDLLETLPVEVVDDDELGYYQSQKVSALARHAERAGADWVVPFDADELWFTHNGDRIADVLMGLPDEALVAEATVLDHVAVDGHVLSPYRRREALPLRKVACRARPGMVVHQGNHGVTYPDVQTELTVTGRLEVRHFPYRSAEQMVRKARNGAAAYAATDLPETVGQHWRDYGRLSDEQLVDVFRTWFFSASPEHDPDLVHDPVELCATS